MSASASHAVAVAMMVVVQTRTGVARTMTASDEVNRPCVKEFCYNGGEQPFNLYPSEAGVVRIDL